MLALGLSENLSLRFEMTLNAEMRDEGAPSNSPGGGLGLRESTFTFHFHFPLSSFHFHLSTLIPVRVLGVLLEPEVCFAQELGAVGCDDILDELASTPLLYLILRE